MLPKMKKYRCKKGFIVDKYDGDGFLIENDYVNVEKGEIYTLDESGRRIIGGEVHLDGDDGSWLEICKENLEKFFEEVQNED